MQTRPKILIALDLDYTHFATSKRNGVHWIGEKEEHLNAYQALINKADAHNIEVIFAVVTSKTRFDDICEEAAKSFKLLLQRDNPMMIITVDDKEFILVKKFEDHYYECLTENITKRPATKKPLLSHFHIVEDCKVGTLLKLGQAHNISPENIILLDDTAYKLQAAQSAGIKTVSFECFNSAHASFFDNKKVVKDHLKRIHDELFNVFGVVMRGLMPNQTLETAIETCQPNETPTAVQTDHAQPQKSRNAFMRLFSCCSRTGESELDERQALLSKR